jgi:SAM-dependent methyltransferase
MELRPDNVSEWDPDWFVPQDTQPDALFYAEARRVVHIDDEAIATVTGLYRELLPQRGALLDLMSSWRSHLPLEAQYTRVAGLGMNADELRDNPQLTEHVVRDVNRDPRLPFGDHEFDAACCAVSVQYLQKPVDVFREVGRCLKVGAPFLLTFSNRCFPTKAISLWLETSDDEHMQLVALYFAAAGNWSNAEVRDCRSMRAKVFRNDPVYAVWAYAK